jgi:hypothetical protein
MRWRDIRFEKPTEADGDEHGYILHLLRGGIVCRGMWGSIDGTVAWMPLSELPSFDPIPDPPEGWRFVEKGETFDKRAKFWYPDEKEWRQSRVTNNRYSEVNTYIVPIDPPEPQYRPFANAAEFAPHRERWWRYKNEMASRLRPASAYDHFGVGTESWDQCFAGRLFEDGTPFGVRVEQ